jgi:putative ABC transport system substrate-binding protein
MRRRTAALCLLTASLWPALAALAQDARRPKVGILSPYGPDAGTAPGSTIHSMLAALAELGYMDGQTVSLEFRFAGDALERLPALAAELVATEPDLIYTYTTGAGRAAAGATSTIPIVLAPVSETTMAALVSDTGRPGGNITGITINSLQRHQKCLQLLKDAAPDVVRVGVLLNPLNPIWKNYPEVLNDAARALGIELVRVEARGLAEIDQAFAQMAAQSVDGLFALDESTLAGARPAPRRIMELIASSRLPSVSDAQNFARAGGLLSFETDVPIIALHAALYIQRILQGAKVAELPVEHPTEFQLVVNLKTAQQLGLTIPPSILLRADEVIE